MVHNLTSEQLNSLSEQLWQANEAIVQLYQKQDSARQELTETCKIPNYQHIVL